MKIANVSNPAAFGAEIVTDDGARMQLVQLRGTSGLLFGMFNAEAGAWSPVTSVVRPERFGVTGPCKTAGEFMEAARRFAEPQREAGE